MQVQKKTDSREKRDEHCQIRGATEAEAELGFLLRRESCKEVGDSPISVFCLHVLCPFERTDLPENLAKIYTRNMFGESFLRIRDAFFGERERERNGQ